MTLTLVSKQPDQRNSVEPLSDVALAARAAGGDEFCLERIMRANNRLLFRTARSILRDDAEAEDVLQNAYVKAYYKLTSFKGQSKLSTWLVRIVINEALERKRKLLQAYRYISNGEVIDIETLGNDVLPESEPRLGPEASAMRAELGRLIQARIDRLPEVFRAVFVLRALEELTVEETASCLKIPQATVRTRYLRARRLLREHAVRDIESALDTTFAFGGAHCDRTVERVLARIRSRPTPTG